MKTQFAKLRPRRRTRRASAPLLDEIAELTARNRLARDPRIERRLPHLRLAALGELEPAGPDSWPPVVPDLFPDAVGLPEVPRQDLTLEVLRSGVFHHGGLVVRGLLDAQTAAKLVAEMDQVLEAQTAYQPSRSQRRADPTFVPFHEWSPYDAWAFQNGSVPAIDAPRLLFELIETFEQTGIGDLAREFFGERPTMLAKKWVLRRVPPDLAGADWHQDGSFMGADIRSLNVWIALSHCGDDAPSMDIVARRLDAIAETGTEGAHFDWSVGHPIAERLAQGTIVRPRFGPGDALLFDHMLLHRTDTRPGMTRPRHAIEAWFASPSTAPPDPLPIVY